MVKQDYKYKEIDGQLTKRCSRCRVFKPITEEYYPKGKDCKYNIRSHCKDCENKPKFVYPNFNDKGLLFCRKCKKYKNKDEFNTQTENKNREGRSSNCKLCNNIYKKRFRKEHSGNDLDRHLSKILSTCRLRAKKNKLKGFNFELDIIFLKELITKQEGKCALSGLVMTSFINSKDSKLNISIDRIDSSKGYTKDNVQLVCNQVNTMKNSLSEIEFYELCKHIINTYER